MPWHSTFDPIDIGKISKLYILQGSKPIEMKELHAGDIGAIAKLTAARTGNICLGIVRSIP